MRTDHQQQNQELEAHVLWVAKQHGHSIVTMLRIYAAWAEGAVEADVETIKRSMNLTSIRRESLALNNLAVDLSVAEGIHRLGAFAFAVSGVPGHTLSGCFDIRKTAKSWIVSYGWGGRIRTSEWRDQTAIWISIINKFLIVLPGWLPSAPFDSPSLPPNLPPAIG